MTDKEASPPHLGTIQDLIDLAYVLVKAINKASSLEEYQCVVDKHQICW